MAVKNIEMNYRNESGYDVLYPQSVLRNVIDWQNSIYNKTQVDSKISTVNSSISSVQSSLSQQIGSVNSNLTQQIQDSVSNPIGWESLGTFNGKTGAMERGNNGNFYLNGMYATGIEISIKHQYWIIVNFSLEVSASECNIYLWANNLTNSSEIYLMDSDGLYYKQANAIFILYPGCRRGASQGTTLALWPLCENGSLNSRIHDLETIPSLMFSEGDELGFSYSLGGKSGSGTVLTNSCTIYRNKVNDITFQ